MLVNSLKKFSEQTKGKLIFDYDLKKLTSFLLRNMFPRKLIDKMVKRFLDNKLKN